MIDLMKSRNCPMDKDYYTCLECYVTLLIYPSSIHPNEVTNLLGLTPSKINIPGAVVTTSTGKTRTVKVAGWFLGSEGKVHSKDLRHHIDWLLNELNGSVEGLIKLQAMDGVKMTVSCTWWSRSWHSGPVLWPEQMSALANLNLECSFDVYFSEDDSIDSPEEAST